jgi:hypothetical protein
VRPLFFFRLPPRLLRRGRAVCDASASIPRPDGRPTWFVVASAASRPGRGPISHTAFRRAVSERMEHATGSICLTGVTTGIFRRLSPWLLGRPPPISRSDRLPFAVEAGGLNTFPAKRGLNIGRRSDRASACLYSVYDTLMWIGCGALTVITTSLFPNRSTSCENVWAPLHIRPHCCGNQLSFLKSFISPFSMPFWTCCVASFFASD